MLEDPSYSSVVRWGDDGDSFVVLENERFTKSILPKHFKLLQLRLFCAPTQQV